MLRMLLVGAAAALVLGGCSSSDAIPQEPPQAETLAPKSQKEVDPEAYHQNIQAAMSEIPAELQVPFQKLFICEVRRNNSQPQPKPIDADYVRALIAHLKANPTAADSCTL